MLTHLRHNAVAYLALAVALSTGTAYAASVLPDGSVTTAKLHKNAVTSAKIKNGSVTAKDLQAPPYVRTTVHVDETSTSTSTARQPLEFSVPGHGPTSVSVFLDTAGANCDFLPAGSASALIHVDGKPVAGVPVPAPGQAHAIQIGGMVDLDRGSHTAQVVFDCFKANGALDVTTSRTQTWTIIQTGQTSRKSKH